MKLSDIDILKNSYRYRYVAFRIDGQKKSAIKFARWQHPAMGTTGFVCQSNAKSSKYCGPNHSDVCHRFCSEKSTKLVIFIKALAS